MWFILLLGLFLPRVVIAFLYLFSNWFTGVFTAWYWLLLGFLFMPYTVLWYSVVMNWYQGVWGALQIIVLVIAVILDVSSYGGRRF